MPVPFSDLQAITPSAVIELFVLELNAAQHGVNDTYRFHAGSSLNANGNIVWAGNTYLRFPLEAEGFEYNGQGQLPRPKMRVSNILGTVTALLLSLPSGLQGAKVTRIRTLARYLDAVNFPARRNLFTSTNLFSWTESATTPGNQVRYRQANAALAPDGNMTATKLSSSTDSSLQRIYRSTSGVVANSPVTFSVYAKAGEYTKVSLRASAVATANAIFDLSSGQWIVNSNATSQFAIDAGNGWYRIGITYTPTSTSTVPWIQLVNSSNQVTFEGDGSSGLFLWGAQLEVGDAATEYQPIGTSFSQNPYGTPDSTAEFPREIYYIDRKSAEAREVVEFELAAAFDLQGVRAPKRQCISSICQWVYRSAECGYTAAAYYDTNNNPVASAAQDVCGKRLNSCEVRFDLYTRTGTVTQGSNVMTLPSSLSILPGEPVRGWGLPAGTTVSAILTGTTIRVSNNSTASSIVTVTGTPSGSGAFMTVSSSAGIAVGHRVSGPYMNGATVTGVSGNTITLSQRPYAVVKSGTYRDVLGDDYIDIPSGTSGISVGMFAFGSFGVNKPVVLVEATRVRIDTVTTLKELYADLLYVNGVFIGLAGFKAITATKNVVAYFVPQNPPAATYTFSASQTYSFRNPNTALPFGSFPGVGGSYA